MDLSPSTLYGGAKMKREEKTGCPFVPIAGLSVRIKRKQAATYTGRNAAISLPKVFDVIIEPPPGTGSDSVRSGSRAKDANLPGPRQSRFIGEREVPARAG